MLALVGIAMLLAEQALALHVHGLSGESARAVRALIILVVGVVVARLLERYVTTMAQRGAIPGRSVSGLRFMSRLLLYLVVVLGILAAFGVGLSSVVFGGAFLTVVIGLAGQTVFGNLVAGITLVFARPFATGDRITFVTWQFPMLMPSYPHEAMVPGYSGTVVDLNFLYTTLRTDTGLTMSVPNGIVLQAAVQNHHRSDRRQIRARFDVDLALDPERVLGAIRARLADIDVLADGAPVAARLVDLGPVTYSVLVSVWVPAHVPEEVAKDAVLQRVAAVIREERAGAAPPA